MKWLRAALVAVLVAQLTGLYLPASAVSAPSILPPWSDNVVHALLFAAPAFLLRLLTKRWWPIWLLALHAPISELIQWRFIPGRDGDPRDLIADLIGVALGCALAALLVRRPVGAEVG